MCKRFLKLNLDNEEGEFLAINHPNAFLLLYFIARRARRRIGKPDGLSIGQAHIGDWQNMGLTRGQYRAALRVLILKNLLEVVETCRTRKKTTTGTTTIGTLVRLKDSRIWDINQEVNNHPNDHRTTTERPPNDHEQEEDISNDISKKEDAQPAKRLRSKDSLSFDFEKGEYLGITEKDLVDWKVIYPHIDLKVEIAKSVSWLKSNPSKSNKSLWRKFITGWLQRANDSIENKKAYKAASATQADRRTKDANGAPVDAPHLRGLF